MKRVSYLLAPLLLATTAAFGQAAAPPPPAPPPPMTVVAQSSEYRFQLDFHVNDAALAKLLPAGWVPNIAAQGPAKDANIRLIFIDALNITGPDARPLGKGSDVMAILAVPVKQASGTLTGQMIVGGLTLNDPGVAFGALDQAASAKVTRNIASTNGAKTVTEDWELMGSNGAHAQLHVKYTAAPANHGNPGTANFYNPKDPTAYQIIRTDQIVDILRNTTTNPPDRVAEYSLMVMGGKFATLFDGTEKALSWDSQHYLNRTIGTPVP